MAREPLPVEGRFNGIRGPKGLSATALYEFLKGRCAPREDRRSMADADYYASAPAWVSVDLGDGKFRSLEITSAGFSCTSPDLILYGKPRVYTNTTSEGILTEGVHSMTLSSDSFTEYSWGTIISDTPVEKVAVRTKYGKFVKKEDSDDGNHKMYGGVNYRSIEYMEEHKPGEPTEIRARWLPDERTIDDEPSEINFKPVGQDAK